MMTPNTMCRPPKPAAINQLPQGGGPNKATTPGSMKHSPMTGTMRTEKAPAVVTPTPYIMSQVAGSACTTPARYSATVSRPPAARGGDEAEAEAPRGAREDRVVRRMGLAGE